MKDWLENMITQDLVKQCTGISIKILYLNEILLTNALTLRLLMSYIYIYVCVERLFLMFLDHTQ